MQFCDRTYVDNHFLYTPDKSKIQEALLRGQYRNITVVIDKIESLLDQTIDLEAADKLFGSGRNYTYECNCLDTAFNMTLAEIHQKLGTLVTGAKITVRPDAPMQFIKIDTVISNT